MKLLSKVTLLGSAVLMLAVLPARAQQTDAEPAGITWGDYITHQSVEFGYRDSLINGNLNNYQTFENLGSGVRLFDYTLEMRSLDHNGLLFDNLSFSNFGYGGDPNNVTRLRIEKNKWYDFRGVFRRDENFWNYNLLANPLNPASSNPAVPIVNSPHALDLVRRMQDYDLTLLPQSRLRFRLGYSRNVNEGPGFTTLDGGTEPVLAENFKFTTNAYRAGVDFRFLPKTTISFDELLTYFKQDSGVTDQNFPFVLSNGTPADLGIVFNTVGKTPCQMPILSPTTPPTANPNCNGFLAYSRVGSPRGFFPTERVAFQSNYFKNLAMSGSLGYSRDDSSVPNFNEFMNSWTSRSGSRGGTVGGPSDAKRLSINVDWAGDYRVTDKFHIVDEFRWDKWSNPGVWDTAETSFFPTLPTSPGQVGLLLPIAQVNPATFSTVCPAPFTAVACPQHMPTSGADITNELVSQFLGQNLKTNTFELEYQLTTRVNARVGYLYTDRSISDFSATVDTGETYFPGGPGGNAGNFFLAARGDCAGGPGVNGCVLNSDGSITEGSLARPLPESGNDSSRNYYHIHEYAFLAGLTLRPMDKLRVSADFLLGSNDNSFTRISPRQVQTYKIHATYTPVRWASIDGAVDIHENRDNVATINNLEHGRTYSFVTTLSPSPRLWLDLGYHYTNIFSQTEICFADPGSPVFTAPCPVAGATGPLGALSFYKSTDHFAFADVMWKPFKRVTTTLGYAGSIVRGNTLFLNLLQPTGPLDFNYLKPYASVAFNIYKGFTYKTAWSYYGYNDHGVANPVGLATLPLQDFNGSNVTFSFRYAY
ncbi:MAG TPA: hypothetical protein VG033_06955 [Candidatus Acidoferrales bacterium]|jgi:hypothetical protein|nr:hypothetical protein [Candidatus Acidoferrales bacterium]